MRHNFRSCILSICRIRRFPGGAEFRFGAEVQLISSTSSANQQWSRPPISIAFQVPMLAASGLHVRFLKVTSFLFMPPPSRSTFERATGSVNQRVLSLRDVFGVLFVHLWSVDWTNAVSIPFLILLILRLLRRCMSRSFRTKRSNGSDTSLRQGNMNAEFNVTPPFAHPFSPLLRSPANYGRFIMPNYGFFVSPDLRTPARC